MSTSFKLVMPPKAKNSANTKACRLPEELAVSATSSDRVNVPVSNAMSCISHCGRLPVRGEDGLTAVLRERILSNDGLVPIGTGGDDGDGYSHQRLQALEVQARVGREFLIARHADGALLPARMLFVHRLCGPEMFGQQRRREHGLAA